MGFGNIFKQAIAKPLKQKKASEQILYLKKEYLKNWGFDILKDLCQQKGLSVFTKNVNPAGIESAIEITPLGFYQVVELIAKNINSNEIIFYARHNNLEFIGFEKKIREIKSFYGLN